MQPGCGLGARTPVFQTKVEHVRNGRIRLVMSGQSGRPTGPSTGPSRGPPRPRCGRYRKLHTAATTIPSVGSAIIRSSSAIKTLSTHSPPAWRAGHRDVPTEVQNGLGSKLLPGRRSSKPRTFDSAKNSLSHLARKSLCNFEHRKENLSPASVKFVSIFIDQTSGALLFIMWQQPPMTVLNQIGRP